MPALDPRQIAERVAAIFRARQPIDILPAELIPADLDTAYRVRAAYEAIEAPRRGALAGYKIGLTTPIMQQLCGVDEPCYGAMFQSEIRHSPAEARVAEYCRVGIETEIAMRLGEDLPEGGDRERVAVAVESCMAAIEVLEDLWHDYKRLTAAAMVVGNVWNAGCVLGAPVADWKKLDLAAVTSCLAINGNEIGSGKGGDVMGNPLNALTWLANKLAADGRPLKRGMVVMTGSMVPIQFPQPGDRAVVTVEGLGRAEFIAV
ncbi:MAG TPA: fumarylacetoacetate hydrolase family protein [Stellaceae bacterium]|nr:fumarylacetoacetate hydrolase family protein [Stellaceae bacterium]